MSYIAPWIKLILSFFSIEIYSWFRVFSRNEVLDGSFPSANFRSLEFGEAGGLGCDFYS